MVKRLCSVLIAIALVGNMLLCYKIDVCAASAVMVDSDTTAELIYLLYTLITTGSIASGNEDGFGSYSDNASVVDAFGNYVHGISGSGHIEDLMDAMTIRLDDGSSLTYSQVMDLVNFAYGTEGSSALAPDLSEEEAEAYRAAVRAKLQVIDGGGGGSDPGDPEEPDPKDPFSKIASFSFGNGFLAMLGDFIGGVQSGEVTGADALKQKTVNVPDVAGNYSYYVDFTYYTGSVYMRIRDSFSSNIPIYMYFSSEVYGIKFYQYAYQLNGSWYTSGAFNSSSTDFISYANHLNECSYDRANWWNNGSQSGSAQAEWITSDSSVGDDPLVAADTNMMVFDSLNSVKNYVNNGSTSGLINRKYLPDYDYPSLTDSIVNTLNQLSGIRLNPNAMPAVNTALATAAQALPAPEPAETIEQNNDRYRAVIEQAVNAVLPSAQAAPEPVPDPFPDPEIEPAEDIDPDTQGMTADLTGIFPFCIPFDLIRLLRALDADPVCPEFDIPVVIPALDYEEHVKINLGFMDSGMQVFRIGELGCFIISLMFATRKVMKW